MMVKVRRKKPDKYKMLWRQINERFMPEPRLSVGPPKVAVKLLNEDDPHQLARQLLELHYKHDGILTLRFYQGRWFHWNRVHYYNIPKTEMRARTNRQLRSVLNGIPSVKKVVRQTVENVTQALEGCCLVEGKEETPSWLGEGPRIAKGDLLAMENGLLDVEAAVSGSEDCLHEPTPYWFSTTYLPYEYDPEAKCPRWLKFLKEVLPNLQERLLLKEFLGYCLTFDTSYHKALILVGEGANGKSVITEVATQLLGVGNVSHVGLEHFDNRFAIAPTIGCLANIVSEIPTVRGVAEDVLKAVISGDRIRVEFKHVDPTDARPTARLIFATNELPQFWDKTEGIWRRLLILPFNVTIPEEEQDRRLAKKIYKSELPGIFNWARRGLRRLRKQGGFTVPKSSKAILEGHRLASNPAKQFLKESCMASPKHKTVCVVLYESYSSWCKSQNIAPLNQQQFGKEVYRIFPKIERKQLRYGQPNIRRYFYVGLLFKKPESQRR